MRGKVSLAKFKVIVSDPEAGSSHIVELEEARAVPLVGRRLGETLDGTVVGLGGHKVKITGGSDRDGFPMRPDIHGGVKTRVILSGGVGYHPKRNGARRRKTLRGNIITEEILQINMKIIEKPKKSKKPAKEKKPKEAKPKEEKPKEAKEEKKAKPEPAKEVKAEPAKEVKAEPAKEVKAEPAKEVKVKKEKPKEVKPKAKEAKEVEPKPKQVKGEEPKQATQEQEKEAEAKQEEGKVE